jgi:hypothetical protein
MPAYLISLCRDVTDRRRLEDYWANVAPAFKGFEAKPLVAYARSRFLKVLAAVCWEWFYLSSLQWTRQGAGTPALLTRK